MTSNHNAETARLICANSNTLRNIIDPICNGQRVGLTVHMDDESDAMPGYAQVVIQDGLEWECIFVVKLDGPEPLSVQVREVLGRRVSYSRARIWVNRLMEADVSYLGALAQVHYVMTGGRS